MTRPLVSFLTALFTAAMPCVGTTAAQDAATPPTLASRLRGAWSIPERGQQLRFDGARCVVAHGAQQTVFAVEYVEPDTVIRRQLGADRPAQRDTVTFDGDAVQLGAVRLERLARPDAPVPAALSLEPMPLGTRTPEAEELVGITADLMARREKEQAIRQELMDLEAKKRAEDPTFQAFASPEGQRIVGRMIAIDRDNTERVRELLADVGWIDAARFGDDASQAAWLIVQHCGNVPMMKAVLPELLAAFENGDRAAGPRYALTYDRLTLQLGGEQRYGSQLGAGPDGGLAISRLEDPANVDARRAAIGLGTLAEYAKRAAGPGQAVAMPDGYVPGGSAADRDR